MNTAESNQNRAPDYRDVYSLSCEPFENRIDPGFFYASTALTQRLDLLTHLTQFGESIILVAGPSGSGKTTLLHTFAEQSNKRWQLCLLDGSNKRQANERLLAALGADTGSDLETAVIEWDGRVDSSHVVVLVIDDAEQLDPEFCDDLCHMLAMPQGERLRVILFGTHEIQPLVKKALDSQSHSRSMQLLEMPRLSEEDTASYLMYRLAVAGYSGESPFTATEVRAICKAGDGRPAAVNQLAHQTLTEHVQRTSGKRQRKPKKNGRRSGPLWLAATGGLLLVVIYAGWQRLMAPEHTEERVRVAETPLDEDVPPSIALATESKPLPPPVGIGSEFATEKQPTAAPAETPPATPERPDASTPSSATVNPAATPESATSNAIPEKPVAQQAQNISPVNPSLTENAGIPETAPTTHDPDDRPRGDTWLLQQPEGHYSLQLLGSRNEQSIQQFIKKHQLDTTKTAYYRGRYKDAEWFVLMYGVFPSRAAAIGAIDTLPAPVRKQKPWPRDINSVHRAIAQGKSD